MSDKTIRVEASSGAVVITISSETHHGDLAGLALTPDEAEEFVLLVLSVIRALRAPQA